MVEQQEYEKLVNELGKVLSEAERQLIIKEENDKKRSEEFELIMQTIKEKTEVVNSRFIELQKELSAKGRYIELLEKENERLKKITEEKGLENKKTIQEGQQLNPFEGQRHKMTCERCNKRSYENYYFIEGKKTCGTCLNGLK